MNIFRIDSSKFKSKITINCGSCKNNKGCKIKKDFRALGNKYESNYTMTFNLKCPFRTPKYKDGEYIKFTIAYGVYRVFNDWDCNFDGESCYHCRNENICKNGIVKFKSKKYKGNIELNGTIRGETKLKTFVIEVLTTDFEKVKRLFNRYDLLKIKEISNHMKSLNLDSDSDDIIMFVSKEKYIKLLNNHG